LKELRLYRKKMIADFGALPDELERAYRAASSSTRELKPGERSAQQVLRELLFMEIRAFGPRLRAILDEELPTFEFVVDEAGFEPGTLPEEMMEGYRIVRLEELGWIEAMPGEAWSRAARHPWFGIRTFQWWVEKSLVYAKDHVEELWEKA
jgi:hypothetical protein